MKRVSEIFLFIFAAAVFLHAEKAPEVGIQEHLNGKIPLNMEFKQEDGSAVRLQDIVDKPTIFLFVYFECPGICTPIMNEVSNVMQEVDLKAGKDYQIISLSIDEKETPQLALQKKQNYYKMMNAPIPENAWRFLTGDSASIKKVTDAAGFYYKRNGKDFIHSGVVVFANKDGKICRYLYPSYSEKKETFGILPFDFKMAIVETSEGHATPTIANLVKMCFSYDPEGKTYVFNLTRIFGAGIVLFAVAFVLVIKLKPKKEKVNKEVKNG